MVLLLWALPLASLKCISAFLSHYRNAFGSQGKIDGYFSTGSTTHNSVFYLLFREKGREAALRNFRWAGWNSPNWNLPGASRLRCWFKILLFWMGCEWSGYLLWNPTLSCSSFLSLCQECEGNHTGVASWLKHKECIVSFPKKERPVAILLFPRGIFIVVVGLYLS